MSQIFDEIMCYVPQDSWSTPPRAPLKSLDNVTWAPTKKVPRGINKKAGAEIVPIRALVLPTKIAEPKPSTKGLVRVRTITKSSGKAILERRREKKAALAIKFFHNGF
jgi:hypothetical protein